MFFSFFFIYAIYTIIKLIQVDHNVFGSVLDLESNSECVTLRRYTYMASTNLTFDDAITKTLSSSFKPFLQMLISQSRVQREDPRLVFYHHKTYHLYIY